MKKHKIADSGTNPTIAFNSAEAVLQVLWQSNRFIATCDVEPVDLGVLHVQTMDAGGAQAAYPEVHHWSGLTFTAWRDGAEPFQGHLSHDGTSELLGQIHGSRPTAFGGKWLAYIAGGAPSGWPVYVRRLDTDVADVLNRNAAGTGLSRVDDTPQGPVVRTIDEDRNVVPGMSNPAWAGQCVVGVTDRDGQPVCFARLADGRECVVSKGEDSQDPRICTDGHSFYVTAWSSEGEGIRVWRLDNSDFTRVEKSSASHSSSRSPSRSGSSSTSHSPSHSPSKESEVNEDYQPVSTPDPILTELSERLDLKYSAPADQGGLGRGPTPTFVDPLGRARWMRDFYIHLDKGDDKDTAWKKVNQAINDIVHITGDPNFP